MRVSSLDPAIAARLKRDADGLVAAVVQQHDTGEVLMVGWMDDEALHRTLTTGRARTGAAAAGVLGQGRDLRPPPVGARGPARLRRRHPARDRRPGGPRLPHRRPHLLRRPRAAGEQRCADRSFGPTVLAGLGGAALAAVAASRTWAEVSGTAAGVRVTAEVTGSEAAPLALALSLVALAAWGVVLVLRGAVRRVLAVVAAAAAAGVVWTVVSSGQPLRSAAGDAVLAAGGTGGGVTTDHTAWCGDHRAGRRGGDAGRRGGGPSRAVLARDGQPVRRADRRRRGTGPRPPAVRATGRRTSGTCGRPSTRATIRRPDPGADSGTDPFTVRAARDPYHGGHRPPRRRPFTRRPTAWLTTATPPRPGRPS